MGVPPLLRFRPKPLAYSACAMMLASGIGMGLSISHHDWSYVAIFFVVYVADFFLWRWTIKRMVEIPPMMPIGSWSPHMSSIPLEQGIEQMNEAMVGLNRAQAMTNYNRCNVCGAASEETMKERCRIGCDGEGLEIGIGLMPLPHNMRSTEFSGLRIRSRPENPVSREVAYGAAGIGFRLYPAIPPGEFIAETRFERVFMRNGELVREPIDPAQVYVDSRSWTGRT
jgi:hypothetical protein